VKAPAEIRKDPEAAHIVQCYYGDDAGLIENVVRFLQEGLDRGRAVVVVATPEHRVALLRRLKSTGGVSRPGVAGGLVLLDALETLAQFMRGGRPDRALFHRCVGTLVRKAAAANGGKGVHAYGEMVGELWRANLCAAAASLERLWRELQASVDVELFCGYPIDVFGDEFAAHRLEAIMRTHNQLASNGNGARLEDALERALIDVVDRKDARLEKRGRVNPPNWPNLPDAEATILWLREEFPAEASTILARAEQYYRAAS
jgi:hypothetical protein